MLTTTHNSFGKDMINHTQIQYSKAQLVGNVDEVKMNDSLRIVFRKDNVSKMIDIANSTICFKLNIGLVANTVPMVLANSAADLFNLVSLYYNGTQLNMLQNLDGGMLYRKIKTRLNGRSSAINSGRYDGFNQQIPQSYTIGNEVLANKPYSDNLDPSLLNLVSADCDNIIAFRERLRLSQEVQKHFTVARNATVPVYTAKVGGTQYYSVKLGDIIPELKAFESLDPEQLGGSGLEINLVLSDPKLSFCRPPQGGDVTAATGPQRLLTDTYKIDNIFLGLVYHQYINPQMSLKYEIPVTSVYQTKGMVSQFTCNHNFSLNRSAFVRGVCITFNTANLLQGAGSGAAIETSGVLGTRTTVHQTWKGYGHYVKFSDYYLSIGGEQYPMTQSPPISDKYDFAYILGQQMSEQIFGAAYGVDFPSYLTTDFCVFIPVNTYIDQGKLFQLHMAYDDLGANPNLEANIMVVCEQILEISKDGSTKIEQ